MRKRVALRMIAAACLCLTASIGPARAEAPDAVNYDDPNLAITNDFVADSASTCPKTLKGKALDACLIRLGLKSAEIAQAAPRLSDDAAPLSQRRTRTAR